MNDTIGIDISKDMLGTFWLSKRNHKQFSNTKMGLRALTSWIREAEVSLVVFEATGVYHRLLETSLAEYDFPFARVNPFGVRGSLTSSRFVQQILWEDSYLFLGIGYH